MAGLTILDMHRLIEQDVQRMSHFTYKSWESEEVDLEINRQIDNLVNGILDKHFGRDLKVDERQGFQKNQVTLDNLRTITVRNETVTINQVSNPLEYNFNLPSLYYHHIKTMVTISYDCYSTDEKKKIVQEDQVALRIYNSQDDVTNSYYYKTGRDSPLGEIADKVYIQSDKTFKVTKALISYIRKPAIVIFGKDISGDYDPNPLVSINCDLDASLHYMVVNMTSLAIMKILESNPQKIVNLQRELQ